jgi:Sigma-70, region 4
MVPALAPGPEAVLDEHALRDWVWAALGTLSPDERLAVMLRYFSRCRGYQAIAAVTGVPVGTVRSRLNRARSRLGTALLQTAEGTAPSQASLEVTRHAQWEHFYTELHQAPVPRTYRDTYTAGVEVSDTAGRWSGIGAWSAHEREAIVLGVRAQIVGIWASSDLTILEIDFTNPPWHPITVRPAAPSSITSMTAGQTASTSTTSDTASLTRSVSSCRVVDGSSRSMRRPRRSCPWRPDRYGSHRVLAAT